MLKIDNETAIALKDVVVGLAIVADKERLYIDVRKKANSVLMNVLEEIDSYFNKK